LRSAAWQALIILLATAGCGTTDPADTCASTVSTISASVNSAGETRSTVVSAGLLQPPGFACVLPTQLTITYSGTFDMSNVQVPIVRGPSYVYHVAWEYHWFGAWNQLFTGGRLTSDRTDFQTSNIAGNVDVTYRAIVGGSDITCQITISANPNLKASFVASFDESAGQLQIRNVDAPTFALSSAFSLDPNCSGGPGVDIFSAPADWSPLGDGGATVSLTAGGSHDFDKTWQWQHPFEGGTARNYNAAMHTTLVVTVQ
jgi:hypothetical protein